jgi:glutathione synthase/RimK-type ligase-like ATP-grasp enzyme
MVAHSRRVPACTFTIIPLPGDIRADVSAGGEGTAAEMDQRLWRIVAATRPRLLRDGHPSAASFPIGDELIEVNGICPGLDSIREIPLDFCGGRHSARWGAKVEPHASAEVKP